jgi:hypothetical protein
MANLAKAMKSPRYHPPRPWRSKEESHMIRRFALLWFTCVDSSRPSARSWAKQLGISHTWLQKLVKGFPTDSDNLYRELRRVGDPMFFRAVRVRPFAKADRN